MKYSFAISALALAAGVLASPEPDAEPTYKQPSYDPYKSYGDYKGAGEHLPSYDPYTSYGDYKNVAPPPTYHDKKYYVARRSATEDGYKAPSYDPYKSYGDYEGAGEHLPSYDPYTSYGDYKDVAPPAKPYTYESKEKYHVARSATEEGYKAPSYDPYKSYGDYEGAGEHLPSYDPYQSYGDYKNVAPPAKPADYYKPKYHQYKRAAEAEEFYDDEE